MIYKHSSGFVKLIGDHSNVFIVEDISGKRFSVLSAECRSTNLTELPKPVVVAEEKAEKTEVTSPAVFNFITEWATPETPAHPPAPPAKKQQPSKPEVKQINLF